MEAITVAVAALGGAVLAVGVVYAPRVRRKRRRRPVGRTVECRKCGRQLPAERAVVVTGTVMDHGQGAGSAMVAEYHRRCLPRS